MMKFFIPILLGLTTSAVAQSDCVSTYTTCLDNGGADNTCQSDNAKCKNTCANSYGVCLESGIGDAVCMTQYNSCLDAFTVFTTTSNSAGKDCVSLFSACHDSGEADNTCNSYNAQCKDKCSTIYGTCLTSGGADSTSCMTQYNNCLDSFSVFESRTAASGIDCVTKFSACHDNGTADNTCNSYNAQCKDKCSVMYGTCLSSGAADDSQCMNQYNNCLDSFTPSTSVDCVSSFTICRDNGGEANTCASYSAQCKDKCSVNYSTCLASGDADKPACLTQYDNCLVSFTTVANSTDCVTKYTACGNDGGEDNACSADNAQCKTDCSTSYSTCLSSGDVSLAGPCLSQYNSCLVSFSWTTNTTTPEGQDCVSKYMACDDADNTCSAENAQCKNSCATSYDTCRSSGDESLDAPCLTQYNNCLVSFTSTVTTKDCTSKYLSCDGEDNTCTANNAQCKNTCSVAYDTCRSSGDEALDAPCLKQYDNCLVSFDVAQASIGEDCVAEYLSCNDADNTCSANNAQCKNKCAGAYDTCNTSGDNSTLPQCFRLYDLCLVSFSVNDTTPIGQDCATKYLHCGEAGIKADNECNADYAQCKNTCATAQDTCRSSGDETLISMCDSLYNSCLDPVLSTNITTNATAVINSTSSIVFPSKTASLNLTVALSTAVTTSSGVALQTSIVNSTFSNTTSSIATPTEKVIEISKSISLVRSEALATATSYPSLVTGIISTSSVPTQIAAVNPTYINGTSSNAITTATSSEEVYPTITFSPTSETGVDIDVDACEI
jgi:hypothetical protein